MFARIPTARLDRYAQRVGLETGVGRRALIDDRSLGLALLDAGVTITTRILAIGEGSHFLKRWLQRSGIGADVVLCSSLAANVSERYDVAFAVEAFNGHAPDVCAALALRSVLRPDGKAIVAMADRSCERVVNAERWKRAFRIAGFRVALHDASDDAASGAVAQAMCCLYDRELPRNIRKPAALQARRLLRDATAGRFAYWIFRLTL